MAKRITNEEKGIGNYFENINHTREWQKIPLKGICGSTKYGKGDHDIYDPLPMQRSCS